MTEPRVFQMRLPAGRLHTARLCLPGELEDVVTQHGAPGLSERLLARVWHGVRALDSSRGLRCWRLSREGER